MDGLKQTPFIGLEHTYIRSKGISGDFICCVCCLSQVYAEGNRIQCKKQTGTTTICLPAKVTIKKHADVVRDLAWKYSDAYEAWCAEEKTLGQRESEVVEGRKRVNTMRREWERLGKELRETIGQ